MGPQRTQLVLRIRHPTADLSPVCGKLGLQAKIIWKKGDDRITPKGTNIGGTRDNSYCSINLDFSQTRLIPKIEAAITLLAPRKALFHELSDTGGRIVFAVGWFLDEDTGEGFKWNVLSALADLRIGLDFYVYVPRTAGEELDDEPSPQQSERNA